MDIATKSLASFFKEFGEKIEKGELSQEDLLKASEFYISCIVPQKIEVEDTGEFEISTREFRKYLFLGWYIYNQIVSGKAKNQEK